MRFLFFLVASVIASALAAAPVAEKPVCPVVEKFSQLSFDAFDQDMAGGWRKIANVAGCEKEAADAIEAYRAFLEGRMALLNWHEGQLRALNGDTVPAIKLMHQSYRTNDQFGWNDYAGATIAFLNGDKKSLLRARKRLVALPEPVGRRCVDGTGQVISCGDWPPNLDVVDALIACFGKSYSFAYATACRPATIRP